MDVHLGIEHAFQGRLHHQLHEAVEVIERLRLRGDLASRAARPCLSKSHPCDNLRKESRLGGDTRFPTLTQYFLQALSKDELQIRPVWHQKEDRVRAHILVCFLAFVLWKTLAGWMQRAGLGDAPRTLLEEFAKIKSGDVVLQARSQEGGPTRTIRLRCVPEPDAAQKVLLSRWD